MYVYECNSVNLYIFLYIFVFVYIFYILYIYIIVYAQIFIYLCIFCVSASPFLPWPHCDVTIEIASQWLLCVAKANKHFFILHGRRLTAAKSVMFYCIITPF